MRTRLGVSQQELANRLGVSLATVSLWERGEVSPSGDNLRKLKELKRALDDSMAK